MCGGGCRSVRCGLPRRVYNDGLPLTGPLGSHRQPPPAAVHYPACGHRRDGLPCRPQCDDRGCSLGDRQPRRPCPHVLLRDRLCWVRGFRAAHQTRPRTTQPARPARCESPTRPICPNPERPPRPQHPPTAAPGPTPAGAHRLPQVRMGRESARYRHRTHEFALRGRLGRSRPHLPHARDAAHTERPPLPAAAGALRL